MHESTERRKTWDVHSLNGWYLGTSDKHYRCHKIFCQKTRAERISDTVFFQHRYLTQPAVTPADAIIKAMGDLRSALKHRSNHSGNAEMEALRQMDSILTPEKTSGTQNQKRVTFDAAVLPIAPSTRPLASQQTQERTPNIAPRVIDGAPRVVAAAVIDKPYGPSHPMTTRSRTQTQQAVFNKQLRSVSNRHCATDFEAAMNLMESNLKSESAHAIFDEESGQMLKYRKLITHPKYKEAWTHSSANEFGRLAQGVGTRINGTNTIFFIGKHEVPADRRRDITYGKFVCEYKPNKTEKERTRFTVGGDKINYPGDCATPTGDLTLFKTMLNSVVSTPGARFMTLDIKNFYLNTPMERYEYVRIKIEDIPDEIIQQYNLREKTDPDGYVFIEVRKGMYGLPQAGILAQRLLEQRLNKHGYAQNQAVPGLWTHKTRPISFTLVVDDFGIKYVGREHAMHLISILKEHYEIAEDWKGKKFIGLTLDWDYVTQKVHVSMPGYIDNALARFQHERPKRKQYSPHKHVSPTYGARVQYVENEQLGLPLDKTQKTYVQAVTGTLLYYARAVDSTILTALNAIATQQANPTQSTLEEVKQVLDYCASQEEAVVTYHSSSMILAVHSDASYLNERKSRSRAGGHFYLSNDVAYPPNNGAILNIAKVIDVVVSSAAEAELGALFMNAREAVYLRRILTEMGHPQPKTPIQTDNSTAEGVINSKIQPKRTKSMDMRFEWLKDREAKEQFRFYWRSGKTNLADYFTKHHPPAHHRNVRAEFLTRVADLLKLRGGSDTAQNIMIGDNLLKPKDCKGVLNSRYVTTYLVKRLS